MSFSKSEIRQAQKEFIEMIEKYFGSVWRIKTSGNYLGQSWDCPSMLVLDAGLWRLCQSVLHKGTKRASGKIEDHGKFLRFIIFYDPEVSDSILH